MAAQPRTFQIVPPSAVHPNHGLHGWANMSSTRFALLFAAILPFTSSVTLCAASLAEKEAASALFGALERYLDATDNLSAVISVRSYVGPIADMEIVPKGKREGEFRYEFDYKRIGNSFRYEARSWNVSKGSTQPSVEETCSYDAEQGRQTSYAATVGMRARNLSQARIAPLKREGTFCDFERFGRFFRGSHTSAGNFYIPFLLSKQADVTVYPASGAMLRATTMFHSIGDFAKDAKTTMWFDVSKNYLLTRVEDQFATENSSCRRVVNVEESSVADGIWVPTRVIEIISIPAAHGPGMGGIYEVDVSNVRIGVLTQEDLAIQLPDNVGFVKNEIDDEQYFVREGRREFLPNSYSDSTQLAVDSSQRSVSFIAVNIVVVILLVCLFAWRRYAA